MEKIIQGTPEWFDLKRGKISATHMADILMKESAAGYQNYLTAVALERITGKTADTYCGYDMQVGIEREGPARDLYSFESGEVVVEVPWVGHPYIDQTGASPDGLAGKDGLVEIKSPKAATHKGYRLEEKIDRNYLLQMQWQMVCTGRQWCDFVSYCPDFPDDKQIKIIRVWRDDHKIDELEAAAIKFNWAVEQTVADILAS